MPDAIPTSKRSIDISYSFAQMAVLENGKNRERPESIERLSTTIQVVISNSSE